MQPDQNNPTNQPATPPQPMPGPVLPPEAPYKNMHRRENFKSILSTLLILLIAPILAIAITSFVFQSYEVDGPSMEPTLKTRDRLIIWKANRSLARITNNDYIPERGEVIVFVKKGMFDFDSDKEKQLIKRVIALPGERVTVNNGVMTVYNEAQPNGFNPDSLLPYGDDVSQIVEGEVDVTVGPSEVFVVGDNRNNSLDSRSFGPIPAEDIVGSLSVRILPLSEAQRF